VESTVDASGAGLHPGVTQFRDCKDCPVMMSLPAGQFVMGASTGEAPAATNPNRPAWTEQAEKPQVLVHLAPFAIGKYEVTFAEWDRCVQAGGCSYRPDDRNWGRQDRPVIHVGRDDAQQYIAWLQFVTGEPYRLPSEAEWEYAARTGTTTARWWGDDLDSGRAVCDGCGSRWDNRSTAPVGSFPANSHGLHDMLGNVSEWVSDCWHDTHDEAPPDGAPRIETSPWWVGGVCVRPVQRGGAWSFFPWTVRAARRGYYRDVPDGRWAQRDSRTQGFRVAKGLQEGTR
jgi:formylglycine-generating enzyme required for sulfatase activity